MTKESQRASDILETIVLEYLELVTPGERDIVVERAFASIRAKRARRLSSLTKMPKKEDPK